MKRIYFEFDNHKYYIEVNKQRYAVRQIIERPDGSVSISSRENLLAENQVSVSDSDTLITEEAFDKVWDEQSDKFKGEWNQIKKDFPIGKKLTGNVQYFYPQGIICDVDGVLAMTIDEDYMPGDVMLYPDDVLDGVVIGYEEENMWVIFESE